MTSHRLSSHFVLVGALGALALVGCGSSHTATGGDGGLPGDGSVSGDGAIHCNVDCAPTPPGCHYQTISCDPPGCTGLVCDDGGTSGDAGDDGGVACSIDCAPPPPGCHYEGPVVCSPPSCGTLVCDDGGTPPDVDAGCAPAPCALPPAGCTISDPCTCAMTCDTVMCSGHDATSFPTFDRSCGSDSDCVIANHTTNCCGSIRAMGIASSDYARFMVDEASCDSMYPACGCFSGAVTADDGTTATGASPMPTVSCLSGTCTTSFGG